MTLKLAVRAYALFCVLSLPSLLIGQAQSDYCAFEVVVKSPDGKPVSKAGVSAIDENGITFSRPVTDDEGRARICDVPAGLTDILVGGQRCGAVTVRYLKPYWMKTRSVFVTYQDCGGEDHAAPAGCVLTIRVRNDRAAPLAGVYFSDLVNRPAALQQTSTSDQYGRIFRFIGFGKTLAGTLVKDGYVPKEVNDQCTPGEAYQHTQVVVLESR